MMTSEEYVKNFLRRDRKLIMHDSVIRSGRGDVKSDVKLIADFTEYNPLHNGHLHCMREAQKQVPGGIFTAIVPGPLERSGRGVPYIMTRYARGEAASKLGADIVVEGPPMGIMGSGQYSLCLSRMFQALDVDFIPRGYKPLERFKVILERIKEGHAVVPRPYKIVDLDSKEVLLQGKLDEDNYVIVSLSKSLNKIGFNFKDKFIFIKRIEGVSGTRIRDAIANHQFNGVEDMLPDVTVEILKREIALKEAPLHDLRDVDGILQRVNESSSGDIRNLALIDDRTAQAFLEKRPFRNLNDVLNAISRGFSRHHKNRVLSSLEAGIFKEVIHKYIENYPPIIRVLNYKNREVLKEFKKRIPHRRLEICQ
ncbi:MAG: nucleotidyltransferase family protein [Methanobacterium sp.]|jgi:predicted nucleotidyltransferase|nr:nucleotidyltransferase family protein [Methanobacterium sp.]